MKDFVKILTEGGDKITPKEAEYRPFPNDGKQCDGCSMWKPPNGCTMVSGKISPTGYCVHFEKA